MIASPTDSVQNPASAKSSPALSDCFMKRPAADIRGARLSGAGGFGYAWRNGPT
jgi:hypothetical protein